MAGAMPVSPSNATYTPSDESDRNYFYWRSSACTLFAQVNADGWVATIQTPSENFSAVGGPEFKPDALEGNYFSVGWKGGAFPQADAGCGAGCTVRAATCLCPVTVAQLAVFTGSGEDAVPTRADLVANLTIAAFDPSLFDAGDFVKCATVKCAASAPEVVVWFKIPKESASSSLAPASAFDENTVFEITPSGLLNAPCFLRNVRAVVQVAGGAFEFRSPPKFMKNHDLTTRDAQYETDAVLDQYVDFRSRLFNRPIFLPMPASVAPLPPRAMPSACFHSPALSGSQMNHVLK